MNKEDIQEIREYVMDKLDLQKDGSYSKERKILEKILVITSESLEVSQSSSNTKNHSQQPGEKANIQGEGNDTDLGLPTSGTESIGNDFAYPSADVCECGHHTNDHSYEPSDLSDRLDCDKCPCTDFKSKATKRDSKC